MGWPNTNICPACGGRMTENVYDGGIAMDYQGFIVNQVCMMCGYSDPDAEEDLTDEYWQDNGIGPYADEHDK